MAGIPEPQALSDALEHCFEGRRVRAAVFLTYTFEPDFFELYILPVLLPHLQLSPTDSAPERSRPEAARPDQRAPAPA